MRIRSRRTRLIAAALLALPLLQLTCAERASVALIDGFFDAVNPLLIERAGEEFDQYFGIADESTQKSRSRQ